MAKMSTHRIERQNLQRRFRGLLNDINRNLDYGRQAEHPASESVLSRFRSLARRVRDWIKWLRDDDHVSLDNAWDYLERYKHRNDMLWREMISDELHAWLWADDSY